MRLPISTVCQAACFLAITALASAATLRVGPGEKLSRPSEAFQVAKEGDVIEIADGSYPGDVFTIRTNRLTIRGAGRERAKLPAAGKDAGGKAIWVTAGADITIENIEFSGARVHDRNGAGIRAEGANLTVRNCAFRDCENGILGGNGTMLIEHCEFDRCGPVAEPATHSLYIGADCTKLIFQYNYSHHVIQGHLLKSRAAENWILYNRLSDEDGTGSTVADFPNGGYVVMVGNILQKGPNAQNTNVVAYGMEGLKHERNALFVVHNTMVYENRRPASFFIRVEKMDGTFAPVIRNNFCVGPIPLTNNAKADATGNVLVKTLAEAGFTDAATYDYHLKAGSPALGQALAPGKAADFDLTPVFQYVHPHDQEKRPTANPLDAGAFAFSKSAHNPP